MSRERHINFERLKRNLNELSNIGRKEDYGIYRMAFSEGDMAARRWLADQIESAGLTLHQDGAANLGGRLNWSDNRPVVMTGSHIDTVPGAGHLDGALGVICGLEALRVLHEQKVPLTHPVELVAFSDEEGRFGGLLGSQSMCGLLTPEAILAAEDLNGVHLTHAMKQQGLDAMDALSAQRDPSSIKAFLELHIEQGPVLDRQGLQIGIVDAITGLFKWNVKLIGTANHAGTTPMEMRQDAFQGLAEFAGQVDRVIEEHGSPRSRTTIGRIELFPGAANVVPGVAEFSLEVRDTDQPVLEALADAYRRTLSAIARRRNLMFEFEVLSTIEPIQCHASVISAVEASTQALKLDYLRMPSGAVHDTQIIASIAPAGMIFVPSKEGRSHSPAEWTAWKDIEAGANTLLNALVRLAT
ncbi:MAG: Zn-dependent hydrolase [Candidatus Thiodiazotropha sp.]|jgi:beta-ureidopropionase / N-carbamoyl-L-amino-acid hydrolase